MSANITSEGYSRMTLDYAEVPETPPAHIWAFKALRNGLLGSTRPSPPPVTCSASPEDEVDEITLPPQGSPSSPSKAGILKTPGTISRRKSVTFNHKSPPPELGEIKQSSKETPMEKRTGILSKHFPGRFPSPFTPRIRQSTPDSPLALALQADENDTDIIPISRSALETITAHVDLVLENNMRLQQIIREGQFGQTYNPYSAHPDLDSMKRELEREKSVLKQFWGDFEQQQASMAKRERELSAQYAALSQQMEEQYALQSSTAKIVEDYQETIQQLNRAINEQRDSFQRDLDEMQNKTNEYEKKVQYLQDELDEAKDMIRAGTKGIESRDHIITETQEKLKRTQRQLSQLKMETLESRVGPHSQNMKDGTTGEPAIRMTHRHNTSRRSVSATYNTVNSTHWDKAVDNAPSNNDQVVAKMTEDDQSSLRKVLSPRNTNIEEPLPPLKAPGQDAMARRAAAAKRLEERQRNRERLGKENSCI